MPTATAAHPLEKAILTLPGYDPHADSDGYYFDVEAAQTACDFYPGLLKHVKGRRWAGKPFHLAPWQLAVTANLYGWKSTDDGLRRYREAFIYVAKKNGKTAWAAGQVLMGLCYDDEPGAEVYSAAYSKDQASLVFFFASRMVLEEPELARRLRCYGTSGASVARSINFSATNSFYKPLASDVDALDGPDVHMAVIDELHRHKKPELSQVLEKGTAARDQPLIIYLTTADYSRPSICNQKLKKARDVMSGRARDAQFLPAVFEASKKDDWKSVDTWAKANPCLGVTVSEEFLRRECQKAIEEPSNLTNFQRLHCNIVTDAEHALIPGDAWAACGGKFKGDRAGLEAFLEGRPCYAGLDLAESEDLNALVLVFDVQDQIHVLPFFWVPGSKAAIRERKTGHPYTEWLRGGWAREFAGETTDYDRLRHDILEINQRFPIQHLGYDPCQALQLAGQLEAEGIPLTKVQQGYAHLHAPTKELLRLLAARKIAHGAHPVLDWNSGNVTGEYDSIGRVRPSKKKSVEKIDGVVALIMAILMWQSLGGPPERSSYEDDELTTVET